MQAQLFVWDRRDIKLIVQKQHELVMLEIIAVILLLVHRHAIFVSAMGWVYAAGDFDTTTNFGEDGG
jgi:hypothetical protein